MSEYQQTQIQTTTLTVLNVQSNIQRYTFIYVNIVHMEVDDAAVSRKYHFFFYTFLIQADLKIFFRPDPNYPT